MTDVMHVITGLGTGGAETMLVQIAAALQAKGMSQHVVSLGTLDSRAGELRTAGVDVTVLNAEDSVSITGALFRLQRAARSLRPRVIQGWMYHGNLAATLCHYVCGERGCRKLFWNLRASNMDDARYGRVIRLGAMLSRLPDVVIANSQAGAAFHRARGFTASRTEVIDNGVDTDKFRPDPAARKDVRAELGLDEKALVAIHVARVDPMKDQANFLAAVAQTPAVTGVMIGSGTDVLTVPANVKTLGERHDVPRLLAAGDIVASTSGFGEGFSNAVAEGMSAGLFPIATDVGDARRIVADTGAIVAPGQPKAFAQALAAVSALPAEARQKQGGKARERIVSHFSLGKALERYSALYDAMVG